MTRRSLFDEPETTELYLRPGHKDQAPWDSTTKLMCDMATIMWCESTKRWEARARNCSHFAHAPTPGAAMQAALELRDNPKPVTARRVLL